MKERRGVLVACLFTTLAVPRVMAQSASDGQPIRLAPPAPCGGDSTETHARRGNMIAVPNLERMTTRRATQTLSRLNLKIDVRTVRTNGPEGVVITQSPAFTTFAASGDVVIVCVRRPAIIPNVVGRTFEAGRTVLADSGFESVRTNSFVDDPAQVGIIIRQQPGGGATGQLGSADELIVGMAPPIANVVQRQAPSRAVPPQPSPSGTDAAAPLGRSQASPLPVEEPRDWPWLSWLWKGAVAIAVLLAPWPAMIKARDRRRLAALRVVPRQHPGNPRVVSAVRARDKAQ